MAKTKRSSVRQPKRTIIDEIADTETKPMHETVPVSVRILRSLYLHALRACRDGDYASIAQYLADLIRRDKHVGNTKPPDIEHHQQLKAAEEEGRYPRDQPPRKLGFKTEFSPRGEIITGPD